MFQKLGLFSGWSIQAMVERRVVQLPNNPLRGTDFEVGGRKRKPACGNMFT
jgi:hypothetical protein